MPAVAGSAARLARDQPSSAAVRQASGSDAARRRGRWHRAGRRPAAVGRRRRRRAGVYGAVAPCAAAAGPPGVRVGSGGRGSARPVRRPAGRRSARRRRRRPRVGSSNRGRVKIAVASSPCERNQTASISRKIGASAGGVRPGDHRRGRRQRGGAATGRRHRRRRGRTGHRRHRASPAIGPTGQAPVAAPGRRCRRPAVRAGSGSGVPGWAPVGVRRPAGRACEVGAAAGGAAGGGRQAR